MFNSIKIIYSSKRPEGIMKDHIIFSKSLMWGKVCQMWLWAL